MLPSFGQYDNSVSNFHPEFQLPGVREPRLSPPAATPVGFQVDAVQLIQVNNR